VIWRRLSNGTNDGAKCAARRKLTAGRINRLRVMNHWAGYFFGLPQGSAVLSQSDLLAPICGLPA